MFLMRELLQSVNLLRRSQVLPNFTAGQCTVFTKTLGKHFRAVFLILVPCFTCQFYRIVYIFSAYNASDIKIILSDTGERELRDPEEIEATKRSAGVWIKVGFIRFLDLFECICVEKNIFYIEIPFEESVNTLKYFPNSSTVHV